MNIKRYTIRNIKPNPFNHYQKIEFIGEIHGSESTFDPFVSCHLEWFEASKWIGKTVVFEGWRNDSGCYLISEVVEVYDDL